MRSDRKSIYQSSEVRIDINKRKLLTFLQYVSVFVFQGIDSISDYAISFHYVPPRLLYSLEFYIYHLKPHGIMFGNQDLNQMNTSVNMLKKS